MYYRQLRTSILHLAEEKTKIPEYMLFFMEIQRLMFMEISGRVQSSTLVVAQCPGAAATGAG